MGALIDAGFLQIGTMHMSLSYNYALKIVQEAPELYQRLEVCRLLLSAKFSIS